MRNEILITDIPDEISTNLTIETMDNTAGIDGWRYSTCTFEKKKYHNDKAKHCAGWWLLGYNYSKDAKRGHKNIVRYIMKYGDKNAISVSDDYDFLRDVATGRIKK